MASVGRPASRVTRSATLPRRRDGVVEIYGTENLAQFRHGHVSSKASALVRSRRSSRRRGRPILLATKRALMRFALAPAQPAGRFQATWGRFGLMNFPDSPVPCLETQLDRALEVPTLERSSAE